MSHAAVGGQSGKLSLTRLPQALLAMSSSAGELRIGKHGMKRATLNLLRKRR